MSASEGGGVPAAAGAAPAPFRMGSLGRHSLVYGLGIVANKAVAFLLLPVYTRVLSPADYGLLQLISMTMDVVSIVAGSRIAFGIFHFYHKAADDGSRRTVLSTALLLLAGTYSVAAMGAVLLAPGIATIVFGENGRYALLLRLAAVSLAFEGLFLVPMALFQLRQRSRQFVAVNLTKLALQVTLNVVLLIPFRMGVPGVLVSTLVANTLIGLFLASRVLREVGVRFNGSAGREFLRFGIPLVGMQIATFITTFGDRYFLNRAGDTAVVGLYGLAYTFGFLLVNFGFLPFQTVWDPQRFAIAKRADRDAIFARAFIYLNLGLLSAALGLSLFAGDVLRVIAAPAFHSAAAFVPVIVAAYVFQCWGNFLNTGIYLTEKTEYFTAANWVAAVVAIVGYLTLIPRWLGWGAALASLASLGVRFWLAYTFSQRLWPIRYQWGPVVRLALLALAGAAVSFLAPPMWLPLSILSHVALFVAYAALVWRLPILTDGDRAAVRRILRQPRQFAAGRAS